MNTPRKPSRPGNRVTPILAFPLLGQPDANQIPISESVERVVVGRDRIGELDLWIGASKGLPFEIHDTSSSQMLVTGLDEASRELPQTGRVWCRARWARTSRLS